MLRGRWATHRVAAILPAKLGDHADRTPLRADRFATTAAYVGTSPGCAASVKRTSDAWPQTTRARQPPTVHYSLARKLHFQCHHTELLKATCCLHQPENSSLKHCLFFWWTCLSHRYKYDIGRSSWFLNTALLLLFHTMTPLLFFLLTLYQPCIILQTLNSHLATSKRMANRSSTPVPCVA